jgi:hypothetical protein
MPQLCSRHFQVGLGDLFMMCPNAVSRGEFRQLHALRASSRYWLLCGPCRTYKCCPRPKNHGIAGVRQNPWRRTSAAELEEQPCKPGNGLEVPRPNNNFIVAARDSGTLFTRASHAAIGLACWPAVGRCPAAKSPHGSEIETPITPKPIGNSQQRNPALSSKASALSSNDSEH